MKLNPSIVTIQFEDMPDLPEFWKEQIGLGAGSLYLLADGTYIMRYGSSCPCCNNLTIWKLDKTGKHLETLKDWSDYDNVQTIYRFAIPERLSKHYLKIKVD